MFKKGSGAIAQITVEDIAPALRTATIAIDELKPDPDNENIHNEEGLKALKHSLATHGQQIPVVVDKNFVIKKGHLTVEAARALGWKVVAISQYHKDDDRAAQFRIADNKIAGYSSLDPQKLEKTILAQLAAGASALDFGFEQADFESMIEAFKETNFSPGSEIEQGRLDEKMPAIPITCPKCGHEFEN